MLIHALCEYYDVLESHEKVLPEEYSSVGVNYLVSLTAEGDIDGIIDWQINEQVQQKGKIKEVKRPRTICVPRRTEKSGIDGNIVEHRPLYIFGLDFDKDKKAFSEADRTGKAKKSHEAFVKENEAFFDGLNDPICIAFSRFLQKWCPTNETGNPFLLQVGKEYTTSGFAFCLSGHPEILLHENQEVKEKWESFYREKNDEYEGVAQCAIYGKELPIARIHDKIKSVPGGLSTGNTLINFNNDSETSYEMQQSFNSNISEKAMKHYTQALNYLLSNQKHRTVIDDLTIVHWAASGDDRYDDLFNYLMLSEELDADHADEDLKNLAKSVSEGHILTNTYGFVSSLRKDVSFYIIGLKPNSARISVKFVYRQQFGKLIDNILQHQTDLQLNSSGGQIPLWRIGKEMVAPKSNKEKVDPSTMSKILEAIIQGYPYPNVLFQTMVRRVRTDRDDGNNSYIQMNNVRMGVLKACINRACRANGQKEEITMALNENNTNPAYLCGRLFAVLENIQQRASGYSLNRTIKDAYFTSASTRPAIVFPKLLALSQHHMNKLDNPKYADAEIQRITALLGIAFPDMLSLKEQGIFMLGYYQQKENTTRKIKEYKENQEVNKS